MKIAKKSAIIIMLLALSLTLTGCTYTVNVKVNNGSTANTNQVSQVADAQSYVPVSQQSDVAQNATPAQNASQTSKENAATPQSNPPKKTNEAPVQNAPAPQNKSGKSKAEIISIFNTSANKIKKTAKSITRNYSKASSDENKLELPGALKSIGAPIMKATIKGSDEKVDLGDMKQDYPLSGSDKVSNLTEKDVENATMDDDGKTQKIVLYLYNTTNNADFGAKNGMNIVNAESITESAAGKLITEFNCDYSDCVISCTIDKKTGKMLTSNYKKETMLNIKAMGMDVKVPMSNEDDYTINY